MTAARETDRPAITPTPSLRRRVTVTVLVLFALLLALLAVFVDLALGAQLQRDLNSRLSDRVAAAEHIAAGGASPPALVAQLQGQDIRVRIVTPDGDSYGDPGLGPVGPAASPAGVPGPPGPGSSAAPGGRVSPPTPPDATSTTVTRTLPGGNRLVLVGDTTAVNDVRIRLRWVMSLSAAVALGVAALVVTVGVGSALRPLDRMTALARRITAGDRGTRLVPDRRRTELGRAAEAFDEMLDALEDAENRARSAAATAHRTAERTTRFFSDAAHELRTPLAGIQTLAETFATARPASGTVDPAEQHRAALLLRETRRASRLITDMLDLARIDHGLPLQRSETDLVDVAAAEADRARELSPDIDVRLAGDGTLAVYADLVRVSQILTNLLDNARRHTPPGGTVTLTVRAGRVDARTEATVDVADTGPGVPAGDRERIFERMVRLDDARDRDSGGAGLGLPIARGLARAHGGDVVLLADPGGERSAGATFRLTLPLPGPSDDTTS